MQCNAMHSTMERHEMVYYKKTTTNLWCFMSFVLRSRAHTVAYVVAVIVGVFIHSLNAIVNRSESIIEKTYLNF